MPFKLDIGDTKSKKTFHIETSSEAFVGKKIGDVIKGSLIKELPDDYEFIITGATDNAGFPALAFIEGSGRKKVLLTKGTGLKKVRKKKKLKKPVKGLRLRKTVHGNIIDELIVQINLKVSKQGTKSLEEFFGKKEETKEEKAEVKEEPKEEVREEKKEVKEEKPKEVKETKEEKKEEKPTEEKKPVEKPKEEKTEKEEKKEENKGTS